MAESIAPLLVEAVKPMIEVMVSRVKGEIKLVQAYRKDLNELQRKVDLISSYVLNKTATTNNNSSRDPVEPWMRNVVNILYDVDNMMDVLAYQKQREVVVKKRSQRIRVFWPLKRVLFRRKIGKWIGRINTNIDEALKEAQTIVQLRALESTPTNNTMNQGAAEDNPLQQVRQNVDVSSFVGRDTDVDYLVDKLCNPSLDIDNVTSNCLSVVAIVGFGGLGKTTLAKKVIENKQVTDHFAERIWVVVSQDFIIPKILNNMLELVDGSYSRNASSEIAKRRLNEFLNGKRYLLVLDDVWNTHQGLWNSMKSSLESIGGSKESMILVTTRDKVVAQTMHASSSYELTELSEDDSWSLFKQVAFANKSLENMSMLETTGEKIVRKCKGNPLAIKTIGGILQTKQHSYEWESIEQSELWDLRQDDETGILPSLKLSYNQLPSPFLKKCFSFCAVLPKDRRIPKQWLRSNWVALGLIQQFDRRELMEDIAESYINLLLNISFLQEVKRDEFGDIELYSMHDLVHDLATSVSRRETLLLEQGKQGETTLSDVRHVAINGNVEVTLDFWEKSVVENLRSLHINKSLPSRGLLEYVKYLRVLELNKVGLEDVPKSIAGLKCLRNLFLNSIPIKVLPEFITELYNLQALVLDDCELLEELPRGLANLVNLRHLSINRIIEVPAGMIEQLKCLQTLPAMWVREGGFQISELGYLPHVSGSLEIFGLEVINSKQDAETANLSEKSRLERLRLIWNSDDDYDRVNQLEEVLDGLKPNLNLRLLEIEGYGGEKFPSWIMRMDAVYSLIKIIKLINCRRSQKLPTLGNLPSLEWLQIRNMDSLEHIGAELYGNTEDASSTSSNFGVVYFPSLKKLQLCGLLNLREWGEPCSGVRSSRTFFPSLEELVMEDCPELTTTPTNFPSLTKLTVINNTSGLPVLNILDNESSLTCLKSLHIEKVVELTSLSQKLTEYCTSLQELEINGCHKLTCMPENLSKLIYLEDLKIINCSSLESLPNLSSLASLRCLEICWNNNLKYPSEGLICCTSLEQLGLIIHPKFEFTLPDLTSLTRLRTLNIRCMTKMICQLPDWIYSLPSLQVLHIGSYDELDHFPDISPLLKIFSLKTLWLYGWINQEADISVPEELQHFKTLESLGIVKFENLESLPDWIGNLSSLRHLGLMYCNKLKKLAAEDAMKRLTKLSYLIIKKCPLLEKAIKVNGTEHHKISHIVEVVTK